MAETARYRTLNAFWYWLYIVMVVVGIAIVVYYVFNYNFLGPMLNVAAHYLAIAFFLPFIFIMLPPGKKSSARGVPWYDIVLAALAFGIPIYFFSHAWDIIYTGWTRPTTFNLILGIIFTLVVLEGGRRTSGMPYFIICIVLGLYPLVAENMPGVFFGRGYQLNTLIGSHVFGSEVGFPGLPSRVMVDLLVGFLIFAGVLLASGGGKVFLNLAMTLVGRFRGGPAKVAVVGSGFFGSMSGSAISNVIGTGSVTIPAMKKIGFEPAYAGAIEACASTGGILMPPVMGAVAFVMAEFLAVPYADIILIAIVPSVLFYMGLIFQVDAYAARTGLRGMPREEVPRLRQVLKEGWHFGIAFAFLIWGLLYMRWEAMTPFYTSVLLIALSFFRKETRLGPKQLVGVIASVGRLITETMAILLPIALVIGGLTYTGVASSFTNGLVALAGGNPYVVLLFGAFACYLLGMIGMITPAYIFLAVSMAPAVIKMGFDTMAVHLFILYYSMLACITPPVAVPAFVGAAMAGAPPMKTALLAMRLGIVIYFIPFFFVFNPALIFHGTAIETTYGLAGCIIGIMLIAAGLESYLWGVGKIQPWARPALMLAGILLAFPEIVTSIIGVVLAAATIIASIINRRARVREAERSL